MPYEAASFDAAFSLFGVIFFPDRQKGLSELHRVLKRGGRVAISSWPPVEQMPRMQVLFAAISEQNLNLLQASRRSVIRWTSRLSSAPPVFTM